MLRKAGDETAYEKSFRAPRSQSFSFRWQWQSDLVWRSAFLFFSGSILFAISCSAGLFICIASHDILNRLLVAYPYALGSVLYTWGAYWSVTASSATLSSFLRSGASSEISSAKKSARSCTVTISIAAYGSAAQPSDSIHSVRIRQVPNECVAAAQDELCSSSGRDVEHPQLCPAWWHRLKGGWSQFKMVRPPGIEPLLGGRRLRTGRLCNYDWAALDWAALMGIWMGTMLYNVSCITPAVLCSLPTPLPPGIHAAIMKWAVDVPNVVAGCLFVSGSYACWAAAARTFNLPLLLRARSRTDWACLLYLLGSLGFLSGSLLNQPLFIFAPRVLIDEWFGVFAGYFLGALCFLGGSFLTIAAPASE